MEMKLRAKDKGLYICTLSYKKECTDIEIPEISCTCHNV